MQREEADELLLESIKKYDLGELLDKEEFHKAYNYLKGLYKSKLDSGSRLEIELKTFSLDRKDDKHPGINFYLVSPRGEQILLRKGECMNIYLDYKESDY